VTEQQNRPPEEAAQKAFRGADTIVPDDALALTATRPRCVRCGHPLTAHRSLARGYGRVCWSRTEVGQLSARRDSIGRRLARLAHRVVDLDVHGLALVAALVDDVLDALDEGVAA